ncbi:hypothetical protein, partial [Klebsiella pneumoniae]|uniref:hypothetical protein n=1 Tax=Klebsiella pneumoniae TaxID=573 RepID=UPI001D0E19E5
PRVVQLQRLPYRSLNIFTTTQNNITTVLYRGCIVRKCNKKALIGRASGNIGNSGGCRVVKIEDVV